MDNLIDKINQMFSGFQEELDERTSDEVAYDYIVINELRKERNIKKALKMAAKKYPKEALQYNDATIGDIEAHYEYLLNHEDLKIKINQIKNKKNDKLTQNNTMHRTLKSSAR